MTNEAHIAAKFAALAVGAAAAAIIAVSAPAAFGGIAGASLGDCYNHVISACNQTNHPIPCANSGMDACDEEHSASAASPSLRLKAMKRARQQQIQFQIQIGTSDMQNAESIR